MYTFTQEQAFRIMSAVALDVAINVNMEDKVRVSSDVLQIAVDFIKKFNEVNSDAISDFPEDVIDTELLYTFRGTSYSLKVQYTPISKLVFVDLQPDDDFELIISAYQSIYGNGLVFHIQDLDNIDSDIIEFTFTNNQIRSSIGLEFQFKAALSKLKTEKAASDYAAKQKSLFSEIEALCQPESEEDKFI